MDKSAERVLARSVGKAIARQRVAAGLTQEDVAEKLGLGRGAVARVEQGIAIPTVVRLVELAELFGCSTSELLAESSTSKVDQTNAVLVYLERVSLSDRQMLVQWLDEFSARLKGKGNG